MIIQRSNLMDLEAYSSSMLLVQLCYSPTTSIKAGQDAGRAARNTHKVVLASKSHYAPERSRSPRAFSVIIARF